MEFISRQFIKGIVNQSFFEPIYPEVPISNLGMYITERIKNLDKYNCYDDCNNTDAGHIFNIFNTIRMTHMFRFFNNVDNESSHAECAKTESKESHLLCVP